MSPGSRVLRTAPSRVQTWRQRARETPPAVWVLVALFAVGALLRLAFMVRNRPGLIGYPDTGAYLLDATDPAGVFFDPLRIVGYGFFLRQMAAVSDELFTVTALQHLLGLATAALIYGAARRAGVENRWALLPAVAVVLLGGSQLFFEHSILGETLWGSLLAACVYAAVRAGGASSPLTAAGWSSVAGLLFAASMLVRLPSVFFAPVLIVWLAVFARGRVTGRLLAVVPAVLVALAALAWFRGEHEEHTGRSGFTRNGVMNVYGRVAPWADCSKFKVPKGTEFLCESTPAAQRQGHDYYLFAGGPAIAQFGLGGVANVLPPEGSKLISSWSRAALLGQPFTYLKAVGYESRRLIDSDIAPGLPGQSLAGWGQIPAAYPAQLQDPGKDVFTLPTIATGWPKTGYVRSDLGPFETLERATRPPPLLFAAAYALLLVAIPAARGSERRAAWLFVPLAVFGLLGPVFSSLFDWRYVVPMLGYLAAGAGIGGAAVAGSTRDWMRTRRRSGTHHPTMEPVQ